ncbi:MAG: cobyric acid synthase [Nitrospirota bacterium]|nr:cobyric acid synthase [Nitrospirota bacterium]
MHKAKAIMVQGTGSHVGKSILTAALCRILKQDGYKVAPFKSQNMALNSYVTADGLEMGRAQVVQAEAAGIAPRVEMNPILLKANSDTGCQVILKGKVHGNMSAVEYHRFKDTAWSVVTECYDRLAQEFDVIVIEGAGSPVEVNLKDRDIVNMRVATMANAPVLLAADIDRGGVFASLVGTMELLEPEERRLVAGFVINKFRGDKTLLQPGLDFLREKTGVPAIGVVPYLRDIHVQEEDGVALDRPRTVASSAGEGEPIKVYVLRLPHISNFTDFDAFRHDPMVELRFAGPDDDLSEAHAVIIPGSKNTIDDLMFLKKTGVAADLKRYWKKGGTIVGICGGYQIMGRVVRDPHEVESKGGAEEGLGLLDTETVLEREKITRQAEAVTLDSETGWPATTLKGYEIHMGRTTRGASARPFLTIVKRGDEPTDVEDGAISADNRCWGTYLHGIFDNDTFRHAFLKRISGASFDRSAGYEALKEKGLDDLARSVRENLDIDLIKGLLSSHGSR